MKGILNTRYSILARTFLVLILLQMMTTSLGAEAKEAGRPMGLFDFLMLPRIWVSAVFCLIGLGLLMRSWSNRKVRLIAIVIIFFVFGILSTLPLGDFARGLGLHPSPVCSITKPFLFLDAGRQVPLIFIIILTFIGVLSLVGNKLFCGWACPVGALQEVFYRIPLPRKLKMILPFRVTNLVRTILAIVFFVIFFSVGISIYDLFNPFESLHWSFETMSMVVLFVTLAAAVFMFRPFCYTVCPVGLLTWVLEHVSFLRMKVDKEACTDCNLCVQLGPCPAIHSVLKDKLSRPDCHACGRCQELCPENALRFRRSF
jgi:polyferredoxin